MFKKLLLTVIPTVLDHIPPPLWKLGVLIIDVFVFWIKKIIHFWTQTSPIRQLKQQLDHATTYQEWEASAFYMDRLTGGDLWRHNFSSKKYDYRLISEKLKSLREAREDNDAYRLVSIFRSGLLRNFGSITKKELYNRAYAGTKTLIEDYISEVLLCLKYLNDWSVSTTMSFNQMKLDFYHDAKQSFGSTALALQGGALFGLCHLGVVKALYFKGLLPKIISGTTVGAAVAALACTQTNEELAIILNNAPKLISKLDNDNVDEKYGSIFKQIINKGYSQDVLSFLKYVKLIIGDMTFEESYIKTERILNIVIHPTRKSVPSLLNYLTSPNTIIWSAINASIGTGILNEKVDLYVRDHNNNIVIWHEFHGTEKSIIKYLPPQNARPYDRESPYTRMSELFNVNHFVVSLARPYLAPLLSMDTKHINGWKIKRILKTLLSLEFQHRLWQLDKFGLLSGFIKRFIVDDKTPRTGFEVTIVPELRTLVKDFKRVFDIHNVEENVDYWILVGEKSVWPMFVILWTRCSIEFALDDLYNALRKRKVRNR